MRRKSYDLSLDYIPRPVNPEEDEPTEPEVVFAQNFGAAEPHKVYIGIDQIPMVIAWLQDAQRRAAGDT